MTVSSHLIGNRQAAEAEAPPHDVIHEVLDRHPCVGLVLGVVRSDGTEHFESAGWARAEHKMPISPETAIRIASISKTFTAIAVMQLWEAGLIDLDAPVNDYLRSYRLVLRDPSFRPATIRHLLTHTGGLGELTSVRHALAADFGESFGVGKAPTLAAFYGGSLHVTADPGSRWIYNNHGPATLGQLVEDVRRKPLRACLYEHIFEPLGMLDTDLERSVAVETRLATGYEMKGNVPRIAGERDMVTAGAAGIFSTPTDMARYVAALLGGGTNAHGSILRPETLDMMFGPQYRPHPRVPGMGLGFWRYDIGGHVAVGHQGTIPGFHSQILLAPEDGVAVMAFTNGSAKADFWIPTESRRLLAGELGVEATPTTRVSHRPEVWHDICGWYRLDAAATDVRLRSMIGAGAEVFLRSGKPMLRFLTPIPSLFRGFPLVPVDADDPLAFRLDLNEEGMRMGVMFARDIGGSVDRLHLDMMPLTLAKQPGATNPRRAVAASLTVGATAVGLGLVARRRRS